MFRVIHRALTSFGQPEENILEHIEHIENITMILLTSVSLPVDSHVSHAMVVNKGSSNNKDMEDLETRILKLAAVFLYRGCFPENVGRHRCFVLN